MVIKNKIKDNIEYFSNIEIGGAFMFNNHVYIKITKHVDEENFETEVDAVELETGETVYFAPYDSVKKVKAIIEVAEN